MQEPRAPRPNKLWLDADVILRQNRAMDSDERDIFHYLKTWGEEFVGVREICRRAGSKRRFGTDPEWAIVPLQLMTERGILERDSLGRYRIKPKPKKSSGGHWVSPEIEKILASGGVKVESKNDAAASDEHYEQL